MNSAPLQSSSWRSLKEGPEIKALEAEAEAREAKAQERLRQVEARLRQEMKALRGGAEIPEIEDLKRQHEIDQGRMEFVRAATEAAGRFEEERSAHRPNSRKPRPKRNCVRWTPGLQS